MKGFVQRHSRNLGPSQTWNLASWLLAWFPLSCFPALAAGRALRYNCSSMAARWHQNAFERKAAGLSSCLKMPESSLQESWSLTGQLLCSLKTYLGHCPSSWSPLSNSTPPAPFGSLVTWGNSLPWDWFLFGLWVQNGKFWLGDQLTGDTGILVLLRLLSSLLSEAFVWVNNPAEQCGLGHRASLWQSWDGVQAS